MSAEEEESPILQHFGVKGMKWGVRRERGADGRVKRNGPREGDSEDFTVSRQRKATPNRQLSTKELKQLNERLQLEKTNRELTAGSSIEKIRKGTAIAGTLLAVTTTYSTAYNFIKSPAGQALVSTFKK